MWCETHPPEGAEGVLHQEIVSAFDEGNDAIPLKDGYAPRFIAWIVTRVAIAWGCRFSAAGGAKQ